MWQRRRVRCPFALLLYFLVAIFSSVFSVTIAAVACAINYSFHPAKAKLLVEDESSVVSLFLNCIQMEVLDGEVPGSNNDTICYSKPKILVYSSTPEILALNDNRSDMNHTELQDRDNVTFTVTGKFLGYGRLNLDAECANSSGSMVVRPTGVYEVPVARNERTLNYVFIGVLSVLLCVANFLMASEIKLEVVWSVIKRPIAPVIGFICQFVCMPLISFSVAQIAFVPYGLNSMGLGIFTAGCSPGGGASNAYTYLLDGNIDLSVTMTFLSTVMSYGMMPLWMHLFAGKILAGSASSSIQIPYRNIGISLLLLIIPLNVGIVLWRYKRNWADKARKILRPFFFFVVVFICTFGVYSNFYMFKIMTPRALIAGMCVPWCGYFVGALLALLMKQPNANIVAISLETGIQNTGIAIFMLQLSFPKPDSDIASVMPVIVALFTPVPVLVAIAVHYARNWWPALWKCNLVKLSKGDRDTVNSLSSNEDGTGLARKYEDAMNGPTQTGIALDNSSYPVPTIVGKVPQTAVLT